MVILNWTGEKELMRAEPIYLYVIAEIYATCSSAEKPLKNMEVAEMMETNYGLGKIDEHVITRYKRLLEEFFGYQFEPSAKPDPLLNRPKITRKGCYLRGVANSIDDSALLTLCLMIKSNKTYGSEMSLQLIDNIREMASSERIKSLITTVRDIEIVDKYQSSKYVIKKSMKFTDIIIALLNCIERKTQISITCDHGLKEHYFKMDVHLFPQCVFVKDNEFYLLGTTYTSRDGILLSHTYIHKIRHILQVKETKNKEIDTHQKGQGTITRYWAFGSKGKSKTVRIKDLLNGMGEIHEGLVYSAYFDLGETTFETDFMPARRLKIILQELKDKYGVNATYIIKTYRSDTEGWPKDAPIPNNKMSLAAVITVKAIEEEVFSIALRYRGQMSIVEPEIREKFFRRLASVKAIYEAREKRNTR